VPSSRKFSAFRMLLVEETDEIKRQMMILMLVQEEAKLKSLLLDGWSRRATYRRRPPCFVIVREVGTSAH
jgi:hypothetical protein